MLARAAAARRGGAAARAFKTVAQKKQAAQASRAEPTGRDPYALFKAAIASTPEEREGTVHPVGEWVENRGAYSRAKMLEHHRVGKHFTRMIRVRDAAIAALPEELQAQAREPDHALLPIERRVFTETAPIPDFQLKLSRPARDE